MLEALREIESSIEMLNSLIETIDRGEKLSREGFLILLRCAVYSIEGELELINDMITKPLNEETK